MLPNRLLLGTRRRRKVKCRLLGGTIKGNYLGLVIGLAIGIALFAALFLMAPKLEQADWGEEHDGGGVTNEGATLRPVHE